MTKPKCSFILSRATLEDVPILSTTFHRAYHDTPFFRKMMPDTPADDKWWQESHRIALLDPKTHVVKVTNQENGEIVALARWVLPRDDGGPQPGSEDGRWPDSTEDFDHTLCDAVFGAAERGRKEIMGDRKHYSKLQPISGPGTLLDIALHT
jgi:hypothetical protein